MAVTPAPLSQRPRSVPTGPDRVVTSPDETRATDRASAGLDLPVHSPSHTAERLALMAVDFLAVNAAFYIAWFARYQLELLRDIDVGNYVEHEVYVPLQLALAVCFTLVVATRGLYRLPRSATALDDLSSVFTASGFSLMALFAISTFVRYPAESRLTLIFAWPLMTVLVVCGRTLYLWLLGGLHSRGIGVAHTLVIGDNLVGRMIMQALEGRPHLGFAVSGFLSSTNNVDFGRFRWLGTEDAIEQVVRERRITQVLIALPSTSHEAILRIVEHCRRGGVQFRLVPDLYEMSLGRLDIDTVSGIPLMGLKEVSIRGLNLVLKRGLDLLLATVLVVLLAPVFLVLALAIKVNDPSGPVFFGQTRVGLRGGRFTFWKFRSMRQDADAELESLLDLNEAEGPIFKMRKDPRRTAVGRWLRRWSLDELPQIWNVLRGEMSLVGPRPATPREVALYDVWHLERLEAAPGITGLWQVSGRSELGFPEQVMLDITYIENWSLGLDLRLMLRTIPAVLTGKGAF